MSSHPPILGLRHLALYVENLEACEHFYLQVLGMKIDWKPDADNVYLTLGDDNLALHRAKAPLTGTQRFDHMGFFVPQASDVDTWHEHMLKNNITLRSLPKTHRDGARSFYCEDPAGNAIQILHMPNRP